MEPIEQQDKETSDALTISAEKAFFIIVKARKFDEKVAPSDPGSGSNPSEAQYKTRMQQHAEEIQWGCT